MIDVPPFEYGMYSWEPLGSTPTMHTGGGPERVVTDDPDPDFRPRPVGFTAPLVDADPKRWEGDDS